MVPISLRIALGGLVCLLLCACRTAAPPAAKTCPCRTSAPPASAAGAASALPASKGGAASAPPSARARASTPEECRACRGEWARHGLSETATCNCRTDDAGKECRSSRECQGRCIAGEDPERRVVEPGPPPKGHFLGSCTPFVDFYGCARFIEQTTPVRLDVLPPMMCQD